MGFLASTDTAGADDALAGVKREIRVAGVFFGDQMILAFVTITHFTQTHRAGHVLKFTIAVGGASEAIQGMVGDIQFHDAFANLVQFGILGLHLHTFINRRSARGGITLAAFHLTHTQATRTKRVYAVRGAEFGNFNADAGRSAHHRRAFRYCYLKAVNFHRDVFFRRAGGSAIVFIAY